MTPTPPPVALLPCPWCGCDKITFAEGSTFRWLNVSCVKCGAGPGEVRVQTAGSGTREDWLAEARQDATAAWNTRAALRPPEPSVSSDYAIDLQRLIETVCSGASVMPAPLTTARHHRDMVEKYLAARDGVADERDKVIEECAASVDRMNRSASLQDAAARIRALKTKETQSND